MSYVAPSQTHLKRRLDDYLWRDPSVSLQRLREIFNQNFMSLAPTLIIGGLIRDLARAGVREFKSDVDLVLDAPNADVVRLAARLNAAANRFGGFSATLSSWKIDFWALKNTWAHREGHVNVRKLADVTKCTFFTSDAIAYRLQDKILITREEYLRDIRKNVLEINLLPNPSIHGNLLRAVRRTLSNDMVVGEKLRDFIDEHLDQEAYEYIVETETRLYGYSYAKVYSAPQTLSDALFYRTARIPAKAHHRNQLLLAL